MQNIEWTRGSRVRARPCLSNSLSLKPLPTPDSQRLKSNHSPFPSITVSYDCSQCPAVCRGQGMPPTGPAPLAPGRPTDSPSRPQSCSSPAGAALLHQLLVPPSSACSEPPFPRAEQHTEMAPCSQPADGSRCLPGAAQPIPQHRDSCGSVLPPRRVRRHLIAAPVIC